MLQKVRLLLLLVLTVECSRSYRRDTNKDSGQIWKRGNRGDVFENLFNVYDPTFLSTVWPKIANGVHLLLEMSCWDDVNELFKDLAEGRAWAYDAVDASGRYQSALFAGRRFWLGSKEECLRLDSRFQENVNNETLALLRNSDYLNSVLRKQKYFDAAINEWRWTVQHDEFVDRLAAADRRPPYRMAYTTLHIQLNITKITMVKSYDITMGVCLPQSCPQDDVESIINFSIMLNDHLKSNKSIPRTAKITSSRKLEEYHMETDAGAILLIAVTLLLVVVAIIATLVDFDLLKCVRSKQSMSFDLPTYNNSETKLVDELKRKHNEIKSVDEILAENVNLNLAQLNKSARSVAGPPVTLDVVNIDRTDRTSGSCNRCGKYKRQCPNSKQQLNLPACPRLKCSSFASLSTEDRRKSHLACRLLLCFSLSYCWRRIFNKTMANKDLSLIHVMRILATLWIMFVHVAVIVGYTSENEGDVNDRDLYYYILATGTIAFDTLFFVSGVFSSHHFFYLKSRYSVRELVSFDGACGNCMQFVCFVTNRLIRLLPSYAYVVLLSGVVARQARSSTLVVPDSDHLACGTHWWRNLLYITTLYPEYEQCMQISWYLTTETQLHAIGALACAASVSASVRARFVVVIAAAFGLASTAADLSEAYFEGAMHYDSVYSAYSAIISRGWSRVAPYLVGVLLGWLIHTMRGRMHVTHMTSSLLWGASIPLVCACAALPWVSAGWLSAWLHLAWPFALLWPVLVCSTHYAGMFRRCVGTGGAALSRLSYSMLLLHGAVARHLLLTTDVALCGHAACIWMYFTGTACITVMLSLLLCLLIEMPCCGLFRRLSDCATT